MWLRVARQMEPLPNSRDGERETGKAGRRLCFRSQILGLSRLGWEMGPDGGRVGWGELGRI